MSGSNFKQQAISALEHPERAEIERILSAFGDGESSLSSF